MNWYKQAIAWDVENLQNPYRKQDEQALRRQRATIPRSGPEVAHEEIDIPIEGDPKVMFTFRILQLRNPDTNGYGRKLRVPEITKILNGEGFEVSNMEVIEILEKIDDLAQSGQGWENLEEDL